MHAYTRILFCEIWICNSLKYHSGLGLLVLFPMQLQVGSQCCIRTTRRGGCCRELPIFQCATLEKMGKGARLHGVAWDEAKAIAITTDYPYTQHFTRSTRRCYTAVYMHGGHGGYLPEKFTPGSYCTAYLADKGHSTYNTTGLLLLQQVGWVNSTQHDS